MRAWRGNACNWHQKRRNPGSLFLTSFLDLDHLSASADKWEGDGLDLGLSGAGTSYGSLCGDCVCLFRGTTPKYNTRRAFIFLLGLLSFGGGGRRETRYNSIPITLVGTVPILFFLKVSALEDGDNDKKGYC